MGEKDIAERSLLWYKDVFADIYNVLVFGGKEVIDPNDLREAPCRNWYCADGKLRDMERDVTMYWERTFVSADGVSSERKIVALLGIENQTAYDKNMPLRIAGYDGANLRDQYDNKDVHAVMTLVLNYGASSWTRSRSLADTMSQYVPKVLKSQMSTTPIKVVNLRKLSDRKISKFRSDFRQVASFIRHYREKGYQMTDSTKLRHPREVFIFLSVVRNDPRYAQFSLEEEGGPESMCVYLERALKKEREESLEKGIEEGKSLRTIEIFRDLVARLDQGPEEVLDLMNVSDKDRRICLSALQS